MFVPFSGRFFTPGRADLAFLVHTTSRVLHAIADRLLVYIESNVIHIVSEEPPRLFSGSASSLSPAFSQHLALLLDLAFKQYGTFEA
jgi:hypothetical protein